TPGGVRQPLGAWGPLTIEANGASAPLPVTRLPYATALTASCLLVFRGQLGEEPDAVAAEYKSGSFSCPTGEPPFVDCPISVCWD
ncbi:MAG: hypothetical protein HY002_16765, partial [Candidatus Rokubacteria bacterium]|nr:hypothetical protein [Candidatus Rokubacteria bacterium]